MITTTSKVAMNDAQIDEAARQFSVLAESARLLLLRELMTGEASVGELVEKAGIKQGTVSKHLGILASAGFLERERMGNKVIYRICDPVVFDLCELMCYRLSSEASRRAESLAG